MQTGDKTESGTSSSPARNTQSGSQPQTGQPNATWQPKQPGTQIAVRQQCSQATKSQSGSNADRRPNQSGSATAVRRSKPIWRPEQTGDQNQSAAKAAGHANQSGGAMQSGTKRSPAPAANGRQQPSRAPPAGSRAQNSGPTVHRSPAARGNWRTARRRAPNRSPARRPPAADPRREDRHERAKVQRPEGQRCPAAPDSKERTGSESQSMGRSRRSPARARSRRPARPRRRAKTRGTTRSRAIRPKASSTRTARRPTRPA